jgi:type VI secretion system (T6SS) baseplate-like injector VgrG
MDDLLVGLLEKSETRYYGKYKAFVADNDDPEFRGRLRLTIPDILGEDVTSGWALPCAPYGGSAGQGFFFIPEKKAGVWVEFQAGLLDYPVWTGAFWAKPGGSTEVPDPASQQSPPTSKMIRTMKHTIELADESGKETITIKDETNGNTVTLDKNGIVVKDKNGSTITMDSGGVTVKASAVKIGDSSAMEPLVLGQQLVNTLDMYFMQVMTHTHVGNLGAPTSPPTPPLLSPVLKPTLSTVHMLDK